MICTVSLQLLSAIIANAYLLLILATRKISIKAGLQYDASVKR